MGEIIYLDNGMEAVQANYTKFPLEEFNENPFIMALPPLEDKKNIIKKLAVYPTLKEEERKMANMYRQHMLNRLYQFYQPLPIHWEIWEMIHSLLIHTINDSLSMYTND